ncbi:hypothetical protein RSOCI_03800 [Rhabdochlamydiaceae symbiont of Dictyostelium giganteum]
MEISQKLLTTAGLIKISLNPCHSTDCKIRLYSSVNPHPEAIAKIQGALQQELKKGRIYEGNINQFEQEVQTKSYLIKEKNIFKLISEEDALQLQNGSSEGNSKVYGILGNAYYNLGNYPKAIEYYKKDVEIDLELKGQKREGEIYGNLGDAYDNLGNYLEAVEYYKKGLEIDLRFKDKKREGKTYSKLGNTYQRLGDYHKAIDYHEKHLKVAEELKDQEGEGRAYGNLGNAYQRLGDYHKAIDYYEKHLKVVQYPKDRVGGGTVYYKLGDAHQRLGDYHKAIDYYEKRLKVAEDLKDQVEEGRAYGNLGNVYRRLGDYRQAISYYEKHLEVAEDLKDQVEEGRAYGNLGNVYRRLGDYRQAISYYEKHLEVAEELKDQVGEGDAYSNLGNTYQKLGDYRQAISYYEKHLKIAQKLEDLAGEGKAYDNLGNAYSSLKETHKAISYHKKHLKIVHELKDRAGKGSAYCNLGNTYQRLGETRKAMSHQEIFLKIAQELKDRVGEGSAYCNLGNAYQSLGDYHKAIDYYEKYLKIILECKDKDKDAEGRAYGNLGVAFWGLGKYSQAEEWFRKSINIYSFFQHSVKEAQFQITLFEELSKPYIGLECVLLLQGRNTAALEISDTRRSRALFSLLSQKLSLKESQNPSFSALSIEEIQKLAETLSTTFVMYSLLQLNTREEAIQAWIVSSKGKIPQGISLPIPKKAFAKLDLIFEAFPYQKETKRLIKGTKQPEELFKEKLASWYDLLIAPLELYFPSNDSGETLTFIPDGFLAHLPFGAFYNTEKDQYLIEKYPISIAPSIQVLSLLDQLPEEYANQALLIGNPTTPKAAHNNLKYSEIEVRDTIAPLMNHFDHYVLTQKEATVENIFKYAPNSRWIHITCHGLAQQKPPDDPYSVFEGFFKLAPDDTHLLGELHAKEVNSLALKADLVFMSACHLGRGNLQQEGSIGPIWSFLGAGARSTIASYWPLPEGDMTVKMVDTFYKHYLGIDTPKLNKAKALQQAVLMAMKTERKKPRQWGAFFLSGLIE